MMTSAVRVAVASIALALAACAPDAPGAPEAAAPPFSPGRLADGTTPDFRGI